MGVYVALSKVADGSMYNRKDAKDASVIANRKVWLESQGYSIDDATRLYITYDEGNSYTKYHVTDAHEQGLGMRDNDIEHADALVTKTPGQILFLPVADCIATTFYDEKNGVLMLSHLGRQSLEAQGGVESVKYLQAQYGSRPEDLKVWLSASIGKDTYPIFKLDNKGMKEAIHEQLASIGVLSENIIEDTANTGTDAGYYSYSEYLKGNKPEDGCHAMMAVIQPDA